METILTYLDNMFVQFPQTPQVLAVKENLAASMEDRYNELKAEGKSEHEAVGAVIASFGSMEELALALDLPTAEDTGENRPVVTIAMAEDYLTTKKRADLWSGLGVFLCIICATPLMALVGEKQILFGLVPLFILVAAGVGLFIYTDAIIQRFAFLKEEVVLPREVRVFVEGIKTSVQPKKTATTIVAVMLFILAPAVMIFLSDLGSATFNSLGVVVLLFIVAFGVALLVIGTSESGSCDLLLKQGDYATENKKANRATGLLASIWWPTTTCIFLIWGFLFDGWGQSWVVWPISGVLFGAVSAVVWAITQNSEGNN